MRRWILVLPIFLVCAAISLSQNAPTPGDIHLALGNPSNAKPNADDTGGTTVNFIPVHKHPYYRDTLGFRPEDFPVAERVYPAIFTLPLYPRMLDADVDDVVTAVKKVVHHSLKRS